MRDKCSENTPMPSAIPVLKNNHGKTEGRDQNSGRRRPKPLALVSDTFSKVIDRTFLTSKSKVCPKSTNWFQDEVLQETGNSEGLCRNQKLKKSYSCGNIFGGNPNYRLNTHSCSRIPIVYTKASNTKLQKSQSVVEKKSPDTQVSRIPKRSKSVTFNPYVTQHVDAGYSDDLKENVINVSEQTGLDNKPVDPPPGTNSDDLEVHIHTCKKEKRCMKQRSKSCPSIQLVPLTGYNGKMSKTCPSHRWRMMRSASLIDSILEEEEEADLKSSKDSLFEEHKERTLSSMSSEDLGKEEIWESVEVKLVEIKPASSEAESEEHSHNSDVVEEITKSTILVCRHPNCMEVNQERPFLLCRACDKDIHSSAENGGHLVFDLAGQKRSVAATLSSELSSRSSTNEAPLSTNQHSLDCSSTNGIIINHQRMESSETSSSVDGKSQSDNEANNTDGNLDDTDGLYVKKGEFDGQGNTARASKFRRKKAVKGRRHHTDLTHVTRRRSDIPQSCFVYPNPSKRRHSMEDHDPFTSSPRRSSLNVDLMNLMTGINHRKSESSIASLYPQTNQPASGNYANLDTYADPNSSIKSSAQLRRHSMYQVNINDELISVHIPMEEGKQPELEIVAAVRNSTLRDAVFPLLERRRVDPSTVSVFLDSSHTPLPWNCEIFLLGGKNLHIKNKDRENILSRAKNTGIPRIPNLKDSRPFKAVGHYVKHSSSTRNSGGKGQVQHISLSHHRKFQKRLVSANRHEHPVAQGEALALPVHPSKGNNHLPVMDETSIVYRKREQSDGVSEPEHTCTTSDSESSDSEDELTRRNSLPFRQRLLCEVKNEHPLARNHIERSSVVSAQRARRTNLSVDDSSSLGSQSVSPYGSWSSFEKKSSRPQTKLQQLFNPLNKDREKQEQLNEVLTSYSTNGLPGLPDLMRIPGQPVYPDELFELEAHWSSLVTNASSLTKRQHDQQEAIWELLQTEVQYIKSLKVITDLFISVLLNLQQELVLNEIETEKLFSNINQIYLANCKFWKEHFLTVLESTRETRKPLDPSLMKDGFKKFADHFKPYTKYCLEQKPCLDYMKARYKDNDLFKAFVVWAEAQKQCNRLKLTDLLVKPMQRLTKYSLLLQAVLRKTEDDKQRRAILEMIGNVDRFVSHVNGELKKCHEQERLGAIISKIESYDAVEPPNDECKEVIQQYSELNLWDPMPGCSAQQPRCVIIQSGLKLKDAQMRVDVECMLFTDLLLLCKASKRMDKFKVIKPPMRVDKIVVQELKDKGSFLLLYLNEYRVPVSAFTFHGDNASIRVWIEHIKKAQDLYNEAKMASMRVGDPLFSSDASTTSPNSPSSFLGESVDGSAFIHPHSVEPSMSEFPHAMRPRAYTVGAQDEDEDEDEVDSTSSSHTLPREAVLTEHKLQHLSSAPVESSGSNDSAEEKPQDTGSPKHRHKVKKHSLSLPLGSVHPDDVSAELAENVFPATTSDEEAARLKLHQRRTSRTERRYHTADAIREMERRDEDKDNSIHKRLSWNLGMVDIKLEEKHDGLKNKAFSSDSLRSVHSSSGVSSTGSLHLSPESEISEESETNSVKASPAMGRSMNTSNDSPMNLSLEIPEDATDSENPVPVETEESKLSPEDKHSKSKSTSDIANLMGELTTSQLKDGISSVELPRIGVHSKKLSYSQMLMVKKQLLLNSDLEASEV